MHSHIDTAWLWPYAESRRKVARSWSTQAGLIESYFSNVSRDTAGTGTDAFAGDNADADTVASAGVVNSANI
jgi:hypothetical protein